MQCHRKTSIPILRRLGSLFGAHAPPCLFNKRGVPERIGRLWRGNANGTGVADGRLPDAPASLWEFKTEKPEEGFEATPAIVNDW